MADKVIEIAGFNHLFVETPPGSGVYSWGVGGQITGPTSNQSQVVVPAQTNRTTSFSSPAISLAGYRAVIFELALTAINPNPGATGIQFVWQILDENDGTTFTTYDYLPTRPIFKSPGRYIFTFGLGAGVGSGAIIPVGDTSSSGLREIMGLPLPARSRVLISHLGGVDQVSYSVTYTPTS